MSSPANTTNASDADEATSNNNETTEPLGVTFAGVQAVLTEHSLPLNIGRDDLRDLMLLTLADLRDNILLEYGTQHTRVAPAALARSFEDYVRDLLRLIDEALTALGLIFHRNNTQSSAGDFNQGSYPFSHSTILVDLLSSPDPFYLGASAGTQVLYKYQIPSSQNATAVFYSTLSHQVEIPLQ
ncbi:hypothetical protein AtubIFM55763_009533 [Aspergillus tubingensis]|uniref:Uncharacterized protein n=1 Tax=Aspergillus tubingensis TaxID=5068 RepID=A0A9W6AGH8_ASPTU|nr:hypothetical protein AtubIFM55763_009533 [Aspergillus tubingensis]GLA80619.1 hypothetical protein AtubIFM56815_001444 [Aspergillus tubingensis]GLB22469.1 hypothetical protein AtubIFM61612_003036 [Aspergillus tubingensis]